MGGMGGMGTGQSSSIKHGAIPVSEQGSPRSMILLRWDAGIKTKGAKRQRVGQTGLISIRGVARCRPSRWACRAHDGQNNDKGIGKARSILKDGEGSSREWNTVQKRRRKGGKRGAAPCGLTRWCSSPRRRGLGRRTESTRPRRTCHTPHHSTRGRCCTSFLLRGPGTGGRGQGSGERFGWSGEWSKAFVIVLV